MKFISLLGVAFIICSVVVAPQGLASPTVFPDGVTIHETGVAEGYVLFAGQDRVVHLVDVEGNAVHEWTLPCGARGAIKALANGHLLAKSCDNIIEVDWDSNVVWEFPAIEGVVFHHDHGRLPNGNTRILCRQDITVPSISDEEFVEDFILEVTPGGNIVWEWHQADHFDDFNFPEDRVAMIRERGGDWSHANTLASIPDDSPHRDPRFAPGNAILSLRHQNTIAIVSPITNAVVWTLTDVTIGQHQTHMIPGGLPGGGNILVFDNGWAGDWSVVPNAWRSRIVEIEPTTNEIVFEYVDQDSGQPRGTLFSFAISGAQRLANGNTLITEGRFGRVFEINADKQIVWEYISPFTQANGNARDLYRANKEPLDWAGPHFVPDLSVVSLPSARSVAPGQLLSYAVTVSNAGPQPAVNVQLSHSIPVGSTFESATTPLDWECSTVGLDLHCTTRELRAASSAQIDIVVQVVSERGGEPLLTATADVTSDGNEANLDDNTVTVETRRQRGRGTR